MLHRRIAVLGILITLGLSGCQESGTLNDNIFAPGGMPSGSGSIAVAPPVLTPLAETPAVVLRESIPQDFVYGAIISGNAEDADQFIASIPHKDQYDLITVLAPTSYSDPEANIYTYDSAGVIGEKGIVLDAEVLQNLTCCRMVESLGKIGQASSWNDGLLPMLKHQFPKTSFAVISVNGKLSDEEAEKAASLLKTSLPRKSLLLVKTAFNHSADANIRAFQDEFANDVLLDFNLQEFNSLPVENSAALNVFGRYMRLNGAEKMETISRTGGNFQVAYEKGSAQIKRRIFLVSFGDIMLGRYVRTLMDKNGLDYPFEKLDPGYLKVNDLLLGNLEGPIAEKAISTTKGIAFRFMPDVAALLKKYGFDVLGQANNHTTDMGSAGYDDTLRFLTEAGIVPFGDPREINGNSVAKIEVDGQKIAFLGLEEVTYDIDDDKAVETIKNLTNEGYKVIPFPHWGIEYTHKPNARQVDLAHKFIDAGAVAVIGHHPHVVQAYETYNGRPIFYSLGNAVFDQYWSADTQVGLSIAMIIEDNRTEIFFVPLNIPRSQPEIMGQEDAKKFLEEYAGYGQSPDTEKTALKEGHLVNTFTD